MIPVSPERIERGSPGPKRRSHSHRNSLPLDHEARSSTIEPDAHAHRSQNTEGRSPAVVGRRESFVAPGPFVTPWRMVAQRSESKVWLSSCRPARAADIATKKAMKDARGSLPEKMFRRVTRVVRTG